ncbi:Gfo/Idh/MocA family protein (plasmid) [Nitrobacteraceae bacterium UC4449_H16]
MYQPTESGKIRWGVMGTAKIALAKVIPAMMKSRHGAVVAIASRDRTKAEAAARRLGLPRSYGSYEALLADPDIDAIYIPLPNHLHVPWSIAALEANKHVLCEKPIALSAADACSLKKARDRSGRYVLEAFMVRHHPQWLRAQEIVTQGGLGDVRLIQATISYFNDDPANVRNRAEIGGGALYDVGCYAVALARMVFGTEPIRAIALLDRDPTLQIDRLTSGIVDFGEGRQLVFSSATQLVRFQTFELFGAAGRVEVPISINAPQGQTTEIRIDRGGALDGSGLASEMLPPYDQYTLQAEEAERVFLGEIPPPYPIDDAVANMCVLDALRRSESSNHWEDIRTQ